MFQTSVSVKTRSAILYLRSYQDQKMLQRSRPESGPGQPPNRFRMEHCEYGTLSSSQPHVGTNLGKSLNPAGGLEVSIYFEISQPHVAFR